MIGVMARLAVPKMTEPWGDFAAAAMAGFGFVSGYVGSAGAPFCGSLGQCMKLAVDRGPAGFNPPSLIPGAVGAALLGAAVYPAVPARVASHPGGARAEAR